MKSTEMLESNMGPVESNSRGAYIKESKGATKHDIPQDLGYSFFSLDFIDHRMLTLIVRNPKIKDIELAKYLGIGRQYVSKRRKRDRFKKALWELTAPAESLLRDAATEAVSLLRNTVRRVSEPTMGPDGNPAEISQNDRRLAMESAKALLAPVIGTKIKIEDGTAFESVSDDEVKGAAVMYRRSRRRARAESRNNAY